MFNLTLLPKRLWFLFFFLDIFLPAGIVRADTGPKPSMQFEFEQDIAAEPVTILSGILYECQQSDCGDAAPLEEVGPQGFYCQADSCSATAYGFAPYHRIEIEFSDGQRRQSNIFETAGFDSRYAVTIRQEDLQVEAQFSSPIPAVTTAVLLLCCCVLTGGILLVVLIVWAIRRTSRN